MSDSSKMVHDTELQWQSGRPIWSRVWSIYSCHGRWPWTAHKPHFKVTLIFNADCCWRQAYKVDAYLGLQSIKSYCTNGAISSDLARFSVIPFNRADLPMPNVVLLRSLR